MANKTLLPIHNNARFTTNDANDAIGTQLRQNVIKTMHHFHQQKQPQQAPTLIQSKLIRFTQIPPQRQPRKAPLFILEQLKDT